MSRVGLRVNEQMDMKSCRVNGGFRPLAISHSMALVRFTDPTVRVYPSGAAWAPATPPIMPVAPDLLTTTIGCPITFSATEAKARLCRSRVPPGGMGLIKVMGRVGYSAPPASAAKPNRKQMTHAKILEIFITTSLFMLRQCLEFEAPKVR